MSYFSLKWAQKEYLSLQIISLSPKEHSSLGQIFLQYVSRDSNSTTGPSYKENCPIIKWIGETLGLTEANCFFCCRTSERPLYISAQCDIPKRDERKQRFPNTFDHWVPLVHSISRATSAHTSVNTALSELWASTCSGFRHQFPSLTAISPSQQEDISSREVVEIRGEETRK